MWIRHNEAARLKWLVCSLVLFSLGAIFAAACAYQAQAEEITELQERVKRLEDFRSWLISSDFLIADRR